MSSHCLLRPLVLVLALLALSLRTPTPARGEPLASGPADGVWTQPQGPTEMGHTAILDPLRDRMVVYGGGADDVWVLSLSAPLAWSHLAVAGTPPPERLDPSAIYDPVRDRMLVFGGSNDSDVWALSLAGAPAWTQLTPAGAPPLGRHCHSAIYDPLRDRMVVFGGYGAGNVLLNDAWALSLSGAPAWTALAPTGSLPMTRERHSAIYDPVRDRMLVFGGIHYDTSELDLEDVWALSLAGTPAWTPLPLAAPPSGRWGHSATYDAVQDRMVVFGGYGGSLLNDAWSLSLSGTPGWAHLAPAGAPPSARCYHSAILDPLRRRLVVFGGSSSGTGLNDAWGLSLADTAAWTLLTPSGVPPGTRTGHSAVLDPLRDRMVVFGGGGYGNDAWQLSLANTPAWTPIATSGAPPSARRGHSAVVDAARDRMVVFGGDTGAGYLDDVWTLALDSSHTWTQLFPAGTPPAARYGHSAVYDAVRDRMLVFGGMAGSVRNDVWSLSFSGSPTWTLLTPTGTPPAARCLHDAVLDPARDRMLVFGGAGTADRNDVWALTLSGTPAWTVLAPTGTPPAARDQASAVLDPVRDRMVVFGGFSSTGMAVKDWNDTWALSLSGAPAWSALAPSGVAPAPRCGHSAILDPLRDRMVVFGGDGRNDVWAMNWGSVLAVEEPRAHALVCDLRPPSPNPVASHTALRFTLPKPAHVSLGVYDLQGRCVARLLEHAWRDAGAHEVTLRTSGWSPGCYLCRFETGGRSVSRKVVVCR
jgi:hypothetical protein